MIAKRKNLSGLIVLVLLTLQSAPALAYLDPGSGSFLLQLLLGGLAGLGVAFSLFWQKILMFLGLRKPDIEAEDDRAD